MIFLLHKTQCYIQCGENIKLANYGEFFVIYCLFLQCVIKFVLLAKNSLGCNMKKMPNTVDNIKQKILALKGKEVNLDVNRGRRKVCSYRAVVEDVYNSVFTVKSLIDINSIITYSYNDILCGEVKISNSESVV